MLEKSIMKKAMFFMLVFVVVLFGGIYLFKKAIFSNEKKAIKKSMLQLVVVSAATAKDGSWAPQIKVTGNLRTVNGVDITTQLAGMVSKIFLPLEQEFTKVNYSFY